MKAKALLFDFDGTIFDTLDVWEHLASMYLDTKGIQVEGIDIKVQSMTLKQGATYLHTQYLIDLDVPIIMQEMKEYMEAYYKNEVVPKEGVVAFIHRMDEKKMPMYILSSGNRDLIMLLLKKYAMLDIFEEIYLCDEIHMDKKSVDVYHHMARLLQLSTKDICVFEDMEYAAKSAKEAGCKVIGIYDKYQDPKIEGVVDMFINKYQELEECI